MNKRNDAQLKVDLNMQHVTAGTWLFPKLSLYRFDPTIAYTVGRDIERKRYSANDKWYPGKISQVYSHNRYDVTFPDGNVDYYVPASSLRAVGGNILPMQCGQVCAQLKDPPTKDNNWATLRLAEVQHVVLTTTYSHHEM